MKHGKHAKRHQGGHAAALRPIDFLTAGEQAIYLGHMERQPETFKQEVARLRERYQDTLRFGRNDSATANGVNFTHYSPEDLHGIRFDNITFVGAKLPDTGYINLLLNAGASLSGCTVAGEDGKITRSPATTKPSAAPASHAAVRSAPVGAHTTDRQLQEEAAWAQHRSGAAR